MATPIHKRQDAKELIMNEIRYYALTDKYFNAMRCVACVCSPEFPRTYGVRAWTLGHEEVSNTFWHNTIQDAQEEIEFWDTCNRKHGYQLISKMNIE